MRRSLRTPAAWHLVDQAHRVILVLLAALFAMALQAPQQRPAGAPPPTPRAAEQAMPLSNPIAPTRTAEPRTLPAHCAIMGAGVPGGFVPSKAELSVEGRERLDALIGCLVAPRYVVGVHTDSRGDQAANLALTEARAQAVVEYLVSRGVLASRLQAQGMGSRQPLVPNDTEEGRRANRRITITPM